MAETISELAMLLVRNSYVKSLIIFIFFLVMAFVILSIFKVLAGTLAAKTKTKIDDLLVERLEAPISLFLATLGLKFAIIPLELADNINAVVSHCINTLLIIIVTYGIIRVVAVVMGEFTRELKPGASSNLHTIFPLIERFTNIFFGTLGFLFIMLEWEVQIGPFLASLGVLGLVLSFALKDSLANIFGGISLILDKNFKVGDVIKLDSGETGEVMDIGLRSTKIKSWDNEIIIMPNSLLSNMKIINYAKPDSSTRVVFAICVDYNSDPNHVKNVLLDSIKNIQGILPEPAPLVRFNKMNDYSLEFKVYMYVSTFHDKFTIEDKALLAIWYALKKAKIGIPFPTRTIFMEKAKKK